MVEIPTEICSESLCNGETFADMKGTEILYNSIGDVRIGIHNKAAELQLFAQSKFTDFVAIKLGKTSGDTIGHKSMKSFLDSVAGYGNLPIDEQLKVWVASMIDNGLADSSRKRYFAKLSTLYNEYSTGRGINDNPFCSVKAACDIKSTQSPDEIKKLCARLDKAFSTLLKDAQSRPALAIFFYLLFNSSSDIAGAINLTADEYMPKLAQLDSVIDPSAFHHRRKYIFQLGQSRKRMPQLLNEVCTAIDCYLNSRGINLKSKFSGSLVTALWIAKARSIGISLSDIRAIVNPIPDEYSYLSIVKPSELSHEQIGAFKARVANAFCPVFRRWYAMKLKRGISFESMRASLKEEMPESFNGVEFFYPVKEYVRREGKKLVTEKEPYIPDIVFFNAMSLAVPDIDSTVRKSGIGWVFRILNTPNSDYSVIDRGSMMSFQKAVGQFSNDMRIEISDRAPMEIGRKVRITGGIMEGYEGLIYDIKDGGNSARRIFCIRLSSSQFVSLQVDIEEIYIEPVKEPDNKLSDSIA